MLSLEILLPAAAVIQVAAVPDAGEITSSAIRWMRPGRGCGGTVSGHSCCRNSTPATHAGVPPAALSRPTHWTWSAILAPTSTARLPMASRASSQPPLCRSKAMILAFFVFKAKMAGVNTREDGHSMSALLTTGQAALLLGSSRQHVVDLCASGRLPYQLAGTHRRVRRANVEALRDPQQDLTKDQLRSLWLHRAVAGKLALDPPRVLTKARRNLHRMREAHPQGHVRADFDAWEVFLEGPLEQLFEALLSTSPVAIQLRQNTPFAGVLTPAERARALSAFRASWQAA